MQDGGTVEQLLVYEERKANDDNGSEIGSARRHSGECLDRGVEEHRLLEEILARVSAQAELGKGDERGSVIVGTPRRADRLCRIEGRLGDTDSRDTYRHTDETIRRSQSGDPVRARLRDCVRRRSRALSSGYQLEPRPAPSPRIELADMPLGNCHRH